MRVTVSCAGRFHAFNLAEQLYRRGDLERFITTTLNDRLLPNRRLPDALQGDPEFAKRVVEIPLPEYLGFLTRKITGDQSLSYFVKDNMYDRRAVAQVPNSDLFVGWASQSLFQLREAKTRGAKTIIERGSSHISEQYRLIEEERRKFGVPSAERSRWDRLLEEKQLKEYHEADYIMVPSEFALQSFIARGFRREKILKARYGVEPGRFHAKSTYNWPEVPTILFVGAIGFQKGVPYLLEAAQTLRAQGKKLRLKFIGRFERDFEEWLKRSPLRSQIDEHLDFVPNHELEQHFHNAEIFCLPSIQEGLALVIAEAMACGLPVIASENTGGREFIETGKGGLITPACNTDAIKQGLANVLDDHAYAESLGRSAAEAAKSFTWDAYGEAIEKVYQSVLSTGATNQDHRDEIASFYDEYWHRDTGWTPTHSFSQAMLDLHFKDAFKPTDRVLDVGCGDASNYQAWLVGQVGKLSAIDISEIGIANARRMGIDAQVHDLSKPFPYRDNAFEGAVCIEVLEHLYDPKFTVSEIFRVLAPGGLLVTSVPNNGYFRERLKALTRAELSTSISDFSNEWKGAHIRFYSLDSFSRMLNVCGFSVESVRSNGDSSIFDGLDAIGGYGMQHATTLLRRKLPRVARLAFLEDLWPSAFAPHIIVRARKPK